MRSSFSTLLLRGLATIASLNLIDAALIQTNQASQAKAADLSRLDVTSSAFQEAQAIPKAYTADGRNISPALTWGPVPSGAKSLALVCDDPDAPAGTWVHWVVYGIPASTRGLPEALPPSRVLGNGAEQGTNSFGKLGYGGPSPPPGKRHRYFFKIYAVDLELRLAPQASAKQVERAIAGHVLAQGQLMGTYSR
jgi:Raf kinase inhibitor-like YbhB/YbcL family protein